MRRRPCGLRFLSKRSEEIKISKSLEIRVDFRNLVCYTNIIVETEGRGLLTVLTEDLDSPH